MGEFRSGSSTLSAFTTQSKCRGVAALPPDAGRDAPPEVTAAGAPREHARMAIERIPMSRSASGDALETV